MFLSRAESFGVARNALLRGAHLRARDLADPDNRVPVSATRDLWRTIVARVPDPALGLKIGRSIKIRELGLVGYSMLNSSTLGDALHRIARYLHIITEALESRLVSDHDGARLITVGDARLHALRHPVDCRLAILLNVTREITGAHIVPLEVEFPYNRPIHIADYRATFGRAALAFDRPRESIKFRARDVARPVIAPDVTLAAYLDQLAEQVLRSLGERRGTSVEATARAVWARLSSGKPNLHQTAIAMGISSRTLQRRLKEHGTSFDLVLDDLRREQSASLLHDRSLAVDEVAFLLGYSEPSTFYRAFRRWHGVTPGKYRATIQPSIAAPARARPRPRSDTVMFRSPTNR